MTPAITFATSSGVWGCGPPGRAAGGRCSPITFREKSVVTTPGITSVTWMFGDLAARSVRRLAVSELSAAFDALYAERKLANGARPRKDETLTICPAPR